MKVYQPMLFVGLGGTGCRVGAELERRLREDLCGPDGTALADRGRRDPFQLPDCLQFVYADFSEVELLRLPHLTADQTLRPAYARTSRATHDLLPQYTSSPAVTQMLRVALGDEVAAWLPPRHGEPKVAPLREGAGQLPTVGRAALFATLRHSLTPVLRPLAAAIDTLARSGPDLQQLGGGKIRGCDVYVAFSVAGGTGAGIFYDYLHLIAAAFEAAGLPAKIYPLVVMPSAFPPEKGGGREAELNAGRAVIDLFRLIDEQNVPEVSYELGDPDAEGPTSVLYPGGRRISLPASTVQTAFLFSNSAGMRQSDLRRSIVSLVLSLLGTDLDGDGRGRAEDDHQSFADSFINKGTRRAARSPSGIGHRGVSTSLVASMTVPVNELAELLAARLLARGVRLLTDPARRVREDNAPLVRRMFEGSGIAEIWSREPLPLSPDPQPLPRGAGAMSQALAVRTEEMHQLLGDLARAVDREASDIARRFNPHQGLFELLKDNDLFRLDRVVNGRREDARENDRDVDPISVAGFAGMLINRRNPPPKPPGVENEAPHAGHIRGRLFGLVRPRWGDPEVSELLEEQDRWYRWRAKRVWNERWRDQENRWRPRSDLLVAELAGVVDAFTQHETTESDQFRRRRQWLYMDRTGVSYLLPAQGDLKDFYEDVIERLRRQSGLPDNEDEAGLLLEIVGHDDWKSALQTGAKEPSTAVSVVKRVIEERIKRLFTESGLAGEQPLLPSLADLLGAAAGDTRAAAIVDSRMRDRFAEKLVGLLPGGFSPEGSGPLRILISYPHTQADDRAQDLLRRELQLPYDDNYEIDFRPGPPHSITVVLFRSEMSLGEVPEVRDVLQRWAAARREPGQEDYLPWRQRTGWSDEWLASTSADREHILHRLLCLMWNGQVDVHGDPTSPQRIRLRLGTSSSGAAATLRLEGYDERLSSWSSLLPTYEDWALLSPQRVNEDFGRELMGARPQGVDRAPVPASALYRTFVHEVAPSQRQEIAVLADELGPEAERWLAPLREFWTVTLEGALTMAFPQVARPVRKNLRELEGVSGRSGELRGANAAPRRGSESAVPEPVDRVGPVEPATAPAAVLSPSRRTEPPARRPSASYDDRDEDDAPGDLGRESAAPPAENGRRPEAPGADWAAGSTEDEVDDAWLAPRRDRTPAGRRATDWSEPMPDDPDAENEDWSDDLGVGRR